MKILIFGSEGFIGKSLTDFYRNCGYDVLCVDVIIKVEPNYFCIEDAKFSIQAFFEKNNIALCINASGAANVARSISEPEWDYKLNVINVFDILNAIRLFSPGCKFLQISSAAVFGNPRELPVKEDANIKPISPYGFHKWQSELLCKEYFEVYGVQTSIVRIFSAFGIGLKKQLFWDIYQKTRTNKNLILSGTGIESRDFIYIDDLIFALHCVVENGKFQSDIYNVANGEEIFIKDAINIFLNQLNWKGQVVFSGEQRPGDPQNWKADIAKLKAIGYKQKINFEEGIVKYCKWLKDIE